MPALSVKCLASWKKYLPEYELRLWDEDNFDVNVVPYVKEAYEAGKYAFVTDYVRLYVLFNFGGIYLDTDVEVLRSFDNMLCLPAFSGYESNKFSSFPTGIMASEKEGIWVKEQLAYYKNIHFKKPDGTYDMTTNTQIISRIMTSNGFVLNGEYQIYKNNMHAFPKDFFCPKSSTGLLSLTENSYCIHHFAKSWTNPTRMQKFKNFIFEKVLGPELTDYLVQLKRKILMKR